MPPVPLDQPYYNIGPVGAVKRFFRKYVVFSGRASRSEFWWWKLANALVGIVLGVLAAVLGLLGLVGHTSSVYDITNLTRRTSLAASLPAHAWQLATLLPTIGVTVRRLHDTDRSGWWYLLAVPSLLLGVATLFVPVSTLIPTTTPGSFPTFPRSYWLLLGAQAVCGIGSLVVLILCIFAPKPDGRRLDR